MLVPLILAVAGVLSLVSRGAPHGTWSSLPDRAPLQLSAKDKALNGVLLSVVVLWLALCAYLLHGFLELQKTLASAGSPLAQTTGKSHVLE